MGFGAAIIPKVHLLLTSLVLKSNNKRLNTFTKPRFNIDLEVTKVVKARQLFNVTSVGRKEVKSTARRVRDFMRPYVSSQKFN